MPYDINSLFMSLSTFRRSIFIFLSFSRHCWEISAHFRQCTWYCSPRVHNMFTGSRVTLKAKILIRDSTPFSSPFFLGCSQGSSGDDDGQHPQWGCGHIECGASDSRTVPTSGCTVTGDSSATLGRCVTHAGGGAVLRQGQASLDHQERLSFRNSSSAHGVQGHTQCGSQPPQVLPKCCNKSSS